MRTGIATIFTAPILRFLLGVILLVIILIISIVSRQIKEKLDTGE